MGVLILPLAAAPSHTPSLKGRQSRGGFAQRCGTLVWFVVHAMSYARFDPLLNSTPTFAAGVEAMQCLKRQVLPASHVPLLLCSGFAGSSTPATCGGQWATWRRCRLRGSRPAAARR